MTRVEGRLIGVHMVLGEEFTDFLFIQDPDDIDGAPPPDSPGYPTRTSQAFGFGGPPSYGGAPHYFNSPPRTYPPAYAGEGPSERYAPPGFPRGQPLPGQYLFFPPNASASKIVCGRSFFMLQFFCLEGRMISKQALPRKISVKVSHSST